MERGDRADQVKNKGRNEMLNKTKIRKTLSVGQGVVKVGNCRSESNEAGSEKGAVSIEYHEG